MTDKQAQLAWLDKQRSIVNDMIINLPPDEQWQLRQELQVINAIAERTQEMTAVEYCEAHDELCKAHQDCQQCPLDNCCTSVDTFGGIKKAVEIVKRWKGEQENGAKTV